MWRGGMRTRQRAVGGGGVVARSTHRQKVIRGLHDVGDHAPTPGGSGMHGRHDSEERRDDEDAHEEGVRGDLIDHVRRHVEEVDEKEWRGRGVKLVCDSLRTCKRDQVRTVFLSLKKAPVSQTNSLEENGEKLREVRRLGRRVRVQPRMGGRQTMLSTFPRL